MLRSLNVCLICRFRLFSRKTAIIAQGHSLSTLSTSRSSPYASRHAFANRAQWPRKLGRLIASDNSPAKDIQSPGSDSEITLAAPYVGSDDAMQSSQSNEVFRSDLNPEDVARHARKMFGDRLPDGALLSHEYKIYERLYGAPLTWKLGEEGANGDEAGSEEAADMLLKEAADGSLEQIEYDRQVASLEDDPKEHPPDNYEVEASLENIDQELRDDIKGVLAGQEVDFEEGAGSERTEALEREPEDEPSVIDPSGLPPLRTHPFTLANRAGTDPTTISLPKEAMTAPTNKILSDAPNQHLRDAAERLFGGPGLPYSTGTPHVSRTKPQKPIPLSAFQSRMLPREANLFLAALMPGMYASLTHVLVESRRNLGTGWLESLLSKEGGPSILDVGAGGAGVLAWREILKAEHARLRESRPDSNLSREPVLGKSTVLTASNALRQRASTLLGDTTFLPRLPDYVHLAPRNSTNASEAAAASGLPHGRKSFDVIVAPHTLWSLQEEWARRQHIQNLWAMLNPEGGVLILLEKGIPRGFEVLAGARQYLLDDLFVPNSVASLDSNANTDAGQESPEDPVYESKSARARHRHAAPGAIIAPCTTHAKCPMYRIPGISRQRKDYCRFAQRYIRPAYQQNVLGAKSRNHEDVEFSYLSVIKGQEAHEIGGVGDRMRLMGKEATDRAFRGYEVGDSDLSENHASASTTRHGNTLTPTVIASASDPSTEAATRGQDILTTPAPASTSPHPLTLARLILPPLKKPRHVHLDVCTPSGTLERWSVPRGWSRQAYRDARKSAWGDLWALGGKTREGRRVRIGRTGGKGVVFDGMKGEAVGRASGVDDVESDNDEENDSGEVDGGASTASILQKAEAEAGIAVKSRRRRPRTLTGRLKARTRKREERAEMAAARSEKRGRANAEEYED